MSADLVSDHGRPPPLLAPLSPAHARGSGVSSARAAPPARPSAGRANPARRARPGLRTYPSAVTRGAVCAESRSLTPSSLPWVSPRFWSREIPYASRRRAFDDGASVFNTWSSSADKAPRASRLTKGSVKERTSVTHAARSNIQAGISSHRPASDPSKVQRKTPPSALSIAE
jgi:hypothetical protein